MPESEKTCSKCCLMCKLCCLLVVIGGINWGLVGLGHFFETNLNVVNLIFGTWPVVENIVYIVVGVAAVMKIFSSKCPCQKK